jgi:hypothetical protein
MTTIQFVKNLFKRDYENYDGVPKMNIYLLRVLFFFIFVFLNYATWPYIYHYHGQWDNLYAAAQCMFGAYALISIIGVFRPLKMLPIALFIIIYKVAWLLVVAYPLWINNELVGSPAEGMANVFVWVIFPIVAMPWRYLFYSYILGKKYV